MNLPRLILLLCCGLSSVRAQEVGTSLDDGPSKEVLTATALAVLGRECPDFDDAGEFEKQQKRLDGAGPKVLPILAELVSEQTTSDLFLINATQLALKLPPSDLMRDALRSRRADPKIARNRSVANILLMYFEKYGDQSDLVWMEALQRNSDIADQPRVADFIQKLRTRLADKS